MSQRLSIEAHRAGLLAWIASSVLVIATLALVSRAAVAQGIDWKERLEKSEAARSPIWVERFLLSGPPEELEPVAREGEGILVNDLERSGLFRVVGQLAADLKGPDAEIARSKNREILATVEGKLDRTASGLRFEGKMSDYPAGGLIGRWEYPIDAASTRQVMHEFADQVVLQLTGEKGIARTQLACVCSASEEREVYILDYDGFGRRRLTRDRSTALSPAWSPVDPLVAYTSFQRGEADLFAVHVGSGEKYLISARPGLDTSASWAPGGRTLAVTLSMADGNPDIYVIRRDGEVVKRLTFHPGIDSSPSFSPTGRQIAFMSDRTGNPQIFTMDADGLDVRRVPIQQSYADSPAWSPRGDRIVYAAYVGGSFDLFLVRPDGSDELRLTDGTGSNENPRWAPDGRHIVFSSNRSGRRAVYVMNADGTDQHAVTPDELDCFYPTWSPRPGD